MKAKYGEVSPTTVQDALRTMERTLISVIVPVYNTEPYLCCCIDSVLNQEFKEFELILIDDGSTDSSGAICDNYAVKDKRVRVIHQENAGQGRARNVGMAQAIGKYIIFLDSDDYWMPSTLETLFTEAERNQTQVLIFGAECFFDGIKPTKHYNADKYSLRVQNDVVKTGAESLKISLDNNEYYSEPGNKFYLLDYLRSNALLFDEGIIHEDARFSFLAYLYADRVECIGDRLYRYRIRPGSTMTSLSFRKSAHGQSVCLEKLIQLWKSHTLTKAEEILLERYCAIRVKMICSLYRQALRKNGWREAFYVQKRVRPVLRQARAMLALSPSLCLATYSLLLHCFFYALYWVKTKVVK